MPRKFRFVFFSIAGAAVASTASAQTVQVSSGQVRSYPDDKGVRGKVVVIYTIDDKKIPVALSKDDGSFQLRTKMTCSDDFRFRAETLSSTQYSNSQKTACSSNLKLIMPRVRRRPTG